ncbi:DUF4837 family protein [bacterium]|nr:DUF4837 family protein [bacterium]
MRFSRFFWGGCLFGLLACSGNSESGSGTLPGSNGAALEVMVVAPDALWNSEPGHALRRVLQAPVEGLPQMEPRFRVVQVEPGEFGDLMRKARNLVFLETDSAEAFKRFDNRWASPQTVWWFGGPTAESLESLVRSNAATMADAITDKERGLVLKRSKAKPAPQSKLMKSLGLSFQLTPGFRLSTDREDVSLFWNRNSRRDLCVMIYCRPYAEDSLAAGIGLIAHRDSVCKHFVPGQLEGSYMKTEMDPSPTLLPLSLDNRFAYEARGLWKVEGDFMGGAFLSYSIYAEDLGRIVTVEGFCFAPEIDKRSLMFELESLLYTVQLGKAASTTPSTTDDVGDN